MWLNSDEAIEVISKEFDFSLWTRLLWVTTHECKLNTRFSECCCREWWEVRSEVSSTYGELRAWLRLGNRCKHLQLQHTNPCQNDVGTTTHWSHYHMRGKRGEKKICSSIQRNCEMMVDGGLLAVTTTPGKTAKWIEVFDGLSFIKLHGITFGFALPFYHFWGMLSDVQHCIHFACISINKDVETDSLQTSFQLNCRVRRTCSRRCFEFCSSAMLNFPTSRCEFKH